VVFNNDRDLAKRCGLDNADFECFSSVPDL